VRSARRARGLPVKLIAPGHGEPFTGHVEVIDRLLAFYEKRQARILELLADGPQTPAQLVPRVFPHAKSSQLYLTLSEVMGNLEVLEDLGRVRRAEAGGRIVFARQVE
jgi:hypothetical protein